MKKEIKTNLSVYFHGASAYRIQDVANLKMFMQYMLNKQGFKISEIHVWFMNDEQITQTNIQSLHHDYPTDVITFVYEHKPVYADICLGIETIAENAKTHKTTKANELLRVLVHATLHILGYNDKTEQEKTEMRTQEDKWMKTFHVKHNTPKPKV